MPILEAFCRIVAEGSAAVPAAFFLTTIQKTTENRRRYDFYPGKQVNGMVVALVVGRSHSGGNKLLVISPFQPAHALVTMCADCAARKVQANS